MTERVTLAGFDFGTTTSSAVIATATIAKSRMTGRMELDAIEERYRSPVIFTPMAGPQQIDLGALQDAIGQWLRAAGAASPVFGGGALLTGLTAQSHNAGELVAYLQSVLGDGVVASANEPRLESWVAFQGAAAALSRKDPQRPYLNLDIGGGTTNLAWGIGGEIVATGSVFVGARHVRVVPGSYTITSLSPYAEAAFAELGIAKGPGQTLTRAEVDALLTFYEQLLAAVVAGADPSALSAASRLHIQSPCMVPRFDLAPMCTFSGGVGALMHRLLQGENIDGQAQRSSPLSPTTLAGGYEGSPGSAVDGSVNARTTTPFGDLGVDLAARLLREPRWRRACVPVSAELAGRATSMGLMRHVTVVSGSSIYLPAPDLLPLRDLPLLGSIEPETSAAQLRELLGLCAASQCGGALRVVFGATTAARVRALGEAIAATLRSLPIAASRPLVLLVDTDAGKALGHYATAFGAIAASVVVVDEIDASRGRFLRIGASQQQVVPVSFFGMG